MADPMTQEIIHSMGTLFVDDTDLYTWKDGLLDPGELWEQTQLELTQWSTLLNATGGALKPEKCFWYMLDYTCEDGEWSYADRMPQELFVTNPDGTKSKITQEEVTVSKKTLGIHDALAGGNGEHLKHIQQKALTWTDRMNDDSSNPRPFVESSGVENTNSGGIDGGTRALSDMDCTDVFWYVLLSDDVEEAPSVIMDGRITEHSHDDNNKSTLQKPDDVVHCNEKTIESPEYDNNVLRQEAIVDEGDDADSPKEDLTPVDDHEASGPINDHVGDDDNEESTRQKHDEIPEATMELPEYHEEAIFHEDDGAGTPKDDLVELDDHEAPVVKQDDTLDLYYFDDNQAYQGQKERQRCQVSICSIM